jgi:hypothetical protein
VRRLGVLLLAVAFLLGFAAPARAQLGGERITRYDFAATIEDDGDLAVVETITYDFGGNEHHGIERTVPTQFRYDDSHDRIYRLSDVQVSSDDAPDDLSLDGDTIRIGDPNQTITGEHT